MKMQTVEGEISALRAELVTYREAAFMRGWAEASVRSWVHRGYLTVVELAPRMTLLVRSEVESFVPPALRGATENPDLRTGPAAA